MAVTMQEVTAAASISITANGTTRVNGQLIWTAPTPPAGATLVSIRVKCNAYTWNGRWTFTLTINSNTVASGAGFDIVLPLSATSPYTITGVGANRNATGSYCNFTNLMVVYTYQIEGSEQLKIKVDGLWQDVQNVYKKIGGVWFKQDSLADLFDENTRYVKGN